MKKELRSAGLLFLTAVVWGFAMAAQRDGAQYLPPSAFNALRFFLGGLALLPLMLRENRKTASRLTLREFLMGATVGAVLFLASLLQQICIKDVGAGKAGFLVSLYVVLVPVLGVFLGKKTGLTTWLALMLAIPALYLLCVGEGERFSLAPVDLLLVVDAVFWAGHILVTDHFVPKTSALKLCTAQFLSAAVLNLIYSLLTETVTGSGVLRGAWAVAYCGLLSTAVGYTLQTVSQKGCRPAFAALILSLESVFCVVAGALLLGERMSARGYMGCGLMLLAVVVAQVGAIVFPRKEKIHV